MSVMLCIDGLSLGQTSKDLRALVETFGQVIRCWVVTQPGDPSRSLRFGFIEATTSTDAERMVAGLTGQQFNCKPCPVAIEKMG
jgi:hypothetical protein